MKYRNIVDLHTHTDNSFDGNHSAMFLCETAVKKGLRAIAFTDHIEIDFYLRDHFDRTAAQSYFEVAKARSAFTGKLTVCKGIELGQPIYDIPTAEELISSRNYDIVIGSIHNLRDKKDFCYLDYVNDNLDCKELLNTYFDEMIALAQWGKFDTMAHLTYPLRYIVGNYGISVDLNDYREKIDTILETLAKKDRALEINTSGLRQKLSRTMPDIDLVKRFRELGGKLITVGSDAHFAEHLGANIEDGLDIAKECGFKSVALFMKRIPTEVPIE